MNQEYWQLRAASRNYFDSHQNVTRLTNRMKALARQGLVEPILNEQLAVAEDARKQISKQLVKLYLQLAPDPIIDFQKETTGLGELYIAQLVGVIGDFKTYTEAWWEETSDQAADDSHSASDHASGNGSQPTADSQGSSDDDQATKGSQHRTEKRVLVTGAVLPAGVRDIWAYCGHGDASRKRRKGMTQTEAFAAGSPLAKSIVHMIADFSVRFNGVPDKNDRPRPMSPYYPLYQAAKANAQTVHEGDWTPLHCHNHALRLVGKAILKDLWRVQHGQDPVYGARTTWAGRNSHHPVPAA
jgi:hypothetical protein